jgi:hypothetical protein
MFASPLIILVVTNISDAKIVYFPNKTKYLEKNVIFAAEMKIIYN